ncbi:hypothetical protein pben1_p70 [Paracoccus phage vB_PbeS_Pben1]|uniref:hypothetical protein n=1 Tax=Paracoccus versutus TaxID=34007 RepID=UPI000E25E1A4|nr:hypothetical protein [Paracoccus versutus]AZV00227.1 hypothetical protein pben1_p70 [Paracoccus phage vB_PbeS_Pben1]WGR55687.1 hypothetical protein E3U25_06835 [Paracoccus versutus]
MYIWDILAIALCGGAVALFSRYLHRRLERRRVLNRLLAVASEDFHDAASSLLKTPQDLPDEVLDSLSMMSRTGFSRGSERAFLIALQRSRLVEKSSKGQPSNSLIKAIKNMRPELQSIFGKAVVAWFNIMTHKSGPYHQKIRIEALKGEAARIAPDQQAISAATSMDLAHC